MQSQQTQEETQEAENDIQVLRQQLLSITTEKAKELRRMGSKQLVWPSSTSSGKLRTLEEVKEIVREIETNPDIIKTNPDFCKGIKGKSLLLDHPFFHLIKDVPCEYMHLVCLEMVKRMIELCFKVGENRETNKEKINSSSSI